MSLIGLESDRLGKGGIGLGLGQVRMAHHQVQHNSLARLGGVEILVWVQVGGLLRDPCQQACLGQRQILGWLAEIDLGRGFRPIGQMAVVEQVEIHFQQLVLAEECGQLLGQAGLKHLAVHGLVEARVRAQEQVTCELHGDGGSPRNDLALLCVLQGGACDACRIDADVVVKRRVLGGDRGVDQALRRCGRAGPRCGDPLPTARPGAGRFGR